MPCASVGLVEVNCISVATGVSVIGVTGGVVFAAIGITSVSGLVVSGGVVTERVVVAVVSVVVFAVVAVVGVEVGDGDVISATAVVVVKCGSDTVVSVVRFSHEASVVSIARAVRVKISFFIVYLRLCWLFYVYIIH